MTLRNPFASKTPLEVMKSEQEKKDIALRLKEVSECAKHILSSQDAAKYRHELVEARDSLIKTMMNNAEPDPIKFSFFCKSALNRLSVYYDLLDSIEGDSNVR
jgi:molecular chaperone DnaK (HSP70)